MIKPRLSLYRARLVAGAVGLVGREKLGGFQMSVMGIPRMDRERWNLSIAMCRRGEFPGFLLSMLK